MIPCGYFIDGEPTCPAPARIRLERMDADALLAVCHEHAAELLSDSHNGWLAVGIVRGGTP